MIEIVPQVVDEEAAPARGSWRCGRKTQSLGILISHDFKNLLHVPDHDEDFKRHPPLSFADSR